jgi:tetratricopeptide (TPR) repeat protein
MTPKFGGGAQKPTFSKKDAPPAEAERGLKRKDTPAPKLVAGRKDDKDKPVFGDVADEGLEEALKEVDAELEIKPNERELHVKKFKILRKMNNRPAMRAALQVGARVCGDPYFGVKLAEALEEEGAFQKALEWRRWVAQFEPDSPDTIRRLAATAVRAGSLQTAEASYAHLIELRKHEESPLGGTFYEEMLGKGLEPAERFNLQKMGLRLISRALQLQESSATLLESAARLAYRVKEIETSCRFYERAIATNPGHRNVTQWKIELLRGYAFEGKQQQWVHLCQSFIAELRVYLENYRGDSRAWTTLAQLLIQAGQFEDALTVLRNALESDSKNAQALWELGRLYVRMGRSQEAIDYYELIISDPNEKKSVRRAIERTLADLYFKMGRYQEAMDLYQRDPESNLRMIAPIYEAMGDLVTAEDLYGKSIRQSPRDARTHLGVAEYWVRREAWARAVDAGREGLRCTYATEEVHSNLGIALGTAQMKQGKIEDALATVEEICQSYPDSIHQQFRKAKLLVMLSRKEEALTIAGEVRVSAQHQTGCAPTSSALWSLLGDCNVLLGHTQEAYSSYTNALKYDFMDSLAVRGLGVLAERLGEQRQALEMYQRFVLLDPLNLATPAIRTRLRELREKLGIPAEQAAPVASVAQAGPAASGPPTRAPGLEQRPTTSPEPQGPSSSPASPPEAQRPAQPPQEGWLGGNMDWYQQE